MGGKKQRVTTRFALRPAHHAPTDTMSSSLLARDVSHRFGAVRALDHVSVDVAAGRSVAAAHPVAAARSGAAVSLGAAQVQGNREAGPKGTGIAC